MEPSRLFREYGTHYVISIVGGGKLEANTSLDMRRYGHNTDFEAAASFAFDRLVASGRASMHVETRRDVKRFYELSEKTAIAIGGTSQLRAKAQDFEQVSEWRASVEANPRFVDFEGPESFRPIWELCEDFDGATLDWSPVPTRPRFMGRRLYSVQELPPAPRKPRWRQIYEAYLEYVADRQDTGFDASEPPEVITELLLAYGKDQESAARMRDRMLRSDPELKVCTYPLEITPPPPLESFVNWYPANLNMGCGVPPPFGSGKYFSIYLLYRKVPMFSSRGEMVINGIQVKDVGHDITEEDKPDPGWKWLHFDLNEGVDGAYLYMQYTDQAPAVGSALSFPIVDLTVRMTDRKSPDEVAGYDPIFPELNKGAGGKYIWLYKKHLL
jgi:hypothetical protein